MCGIAGMVRDRPAAATAMDAVRRMVDRLAHRGPDGRGTVALRASGASGVDAAFGHARLAVIDLSERGAQPMHDARGALTVVFNGEIYNFAELRRALEARGRQFRSSSDTEVILEGYAEWGEAVVEHLDGMFAFGLWDTNNNRLLLARDRIGIKPLYLFEAPGRIVFASEVRALLASRLVDPALDPDALEEYLAYQTAATPRTLVRGVRYLEPGTILTRRIGAASETRTFWDLSRQASPEARDATPEQASARIDELLRESVERHLVSDVPIGVFLSSGIDSSVLALEIARTGRMPRTFTVTFPGLPWDEGDEARRIAAAIGAEHTEVPLTEDDLLRDLPDVLASFDHPSGDGVNTYIVSKAVRTSGLKVAWSGLGGDELFGGYPSFRRLSGARLWLGAWRHAPPVLRSTAARVVRTLGRPSVTTEKAAAVLETDGSLSQTYPVLRQVFSPAERRRMLGQQTSPGRSAAPADPYAALLQRAAPAAERLSFAARVSYAEARTYMHDVLLRDTDQMSMRHGLEVRVPLLDRALVEYVMGLPDRAHRSDAGPKWLLARRLSGAIPDDVVRRPKRGFTLPFAAWMRTALRPYCEARLLGGVLTRRAGFDPAAVERLWRGFVEGRPDVTWTRPWTLVALADWLDGNGISA